MFLANKNGVDLGNRLLNNRDVDDVYEDMEQDEDVEADDAMDMDVDSVSASPSSPTYE